MTRFEDGPAEGLSLILKRAPKFLRAVKNREGTWDALDQLDDAPEVDEQLFAYERHGGEIRGFIDGPKFRGMFAGGVYRFVAEQPDDIVMRDTDAWRAWCATHFEPTPKLVTASCRTCPALVVWLKTKLGKQMPVNAGTVLPGQTEYDPKLGHVSHFATCPNSAKHRKRKAKK